MSSRKKTRRSKQNKFKETLKYEVYGIIIIVLALISLASGRKIAGIGSGGEALTSIFLFISGAHYYIIPITLIYIGLFAMIRRAWPTTWTMRKTGLLIIVLGIVTTEHIRMIQHLDPDNVMGIGKIIAQPFQNFYDMATQKIDMNEYRKYLGGGMVGAFIYGVLNLLFDRLGSKFVVVAMFAIGILCFTGWSYVEMLRRFKAVGSKLMRAIRYRLQQMVFLIRDRSERRSKISQRVQTDTGNLGADEGYEANLKRNRSITEDAEDYLYEQNVHSNGFPDRFRHEQDDQTYPRIRDFQDHVDDEQNSYMIVPSLPEPLHNEPTSQPQQTRKATSDRDVDGNERDVQFRSDALPWDYEYLLPPLHLLEKPEQNPKSAKTSDHKANAIKLEETLESFGVRAKVLEVVKGPTVTRYEVQPEAGVKVSRIVSLTDDIALALAAKDIRMEAPIPGKSAIGIEVPNTSVSMVTLREVMESVPFQEADSKVTIALGRDISGMPIIADLAKMPHLLVAGATGSGKSVCINGMIVSILYKAKPNEVKFLMIDPKKVELNGYNGIPHLLAPVVTDPRRASLALRKVVGEMEKRYELFSEKGVRNIEGYNNWVESTGEGEKLPLIVVIVDELADLMMVAANDVEDSICRLAQMARAAGIHLIIATQRPSVNVITGVIKANIPSRIAFGVSSQVDSRTILDAAGAEKLLGRGDMLFLPVGASKPIRTQGAFLSDEEVEAVVQYVKAQAHEEYQEELVIPEVDDSVETEVEMEDELYERAVQIVVEAKQASVSLLQRRMRIGYTRAARLIDAMEARGIVGPYEGSKPREVLISFDGDDSMKNVGS